LRTYENKDELKNEINKSFAKYISEFNDIPEPLEPRLENGKRLHYNFQFANLPFERGEIPFPKGFFYLYGYSQTTR